MKRKKKPTPQALATQIPGVVLASQLKPVSAARGSSLVSLPEILLKGLELAGDRRNARYVRLRKAIDGGLARPDELKGKQPVTEAVDPQLDEVVKRLMRRVRL